MAEQAQGPDGGMIHRITCEYPGCMVEFGLSVVSGRRLCGVHMPGPPDEHEDAALWGSTTATGLCPHDVVLRFKVQVDNLADRWRDAWLCEKCRAEFRKVNL